MYDYNYVFKIGKETIPIYRFQSKIYRCQIRICQPTEAMDQILMVKENEDGKRIEVVCLELDGITVKHKVKKGSDFTTQISLNDSISINGEALLFCENGETGKVSISGLSDLVFEIKKTYNAGECFRVREGDQIILPDGSILICHMADWNSWNWDDEDW